jgi:dihydroflavonol-4-reductase
MTTLVTGASGFVGAAVVRVLLDAGYEVRVLVRKTSNRKNLQGLNFDTAVGDLRDVASLRDALDGCGALFHVAADYRLWARDPEALYASNVDGSVNVMRAAADAGVERIVYTSSVATLGLNSDGSPADEETPVALDHMIGDYKRSKFLAEKAVTKLVADAQLPVVIVNPSTPIGPRDVKPTPTGRLILDAAAGRIPAFVNTGLNVAHVDDVARGHLQAFEKGTIGERYILGGENMSLEEILRSVAAICGRKSPKLRLPHGLVLPIAYAAEAWARLFGGEPLATVDGVKMSRKRMYFSCQKAERELGYSHRPADEAIRDAVDWFRQNGYL